MGGPAHEYRGANSRGNPGGHVCGLALVGHPWSARTTFGIPGTITHIADTGVDQAQLPTWATNS
jgi:hypothetical protein